MKYVNNITVITIAILLASISSFKPQKANGQSSKKYGSYTATDKVCNTSRNLIVNMSKGTMTEDDDLMSSLMCVTAQKEVSANFVLSGTSETKCLTSLFIQFQRACTIATEYHYRLLENSNMCLGIRQELKHSQDNSLMPEQKAFLLSNCLGISDDECLAAIIIADKIYQIQNCKYN